MKNKLLVFLSLSAILLSGLMLAPILQQPSEARAANSFFDVFIEIDGVQGSSTHVNAMDILSWSFGASNPTSVGSGGAGAGKVSMQDFHFTKRIDKASPMLYSSLAKGEHIKNAVLHVRRGNTDYLKIELSDVLISSYELSGSGGDMPTESVSLNFAKIEFSYDLKVAK